jgi:hypothetical protein
LINKKARESLTKQREFLTESPYTEEDFKRLAELIKHDDKGFRVANQFEAFDYMPGLIKCWAVDRCEEYDFFELLFAPIDRLPLIINEELDPVENIILNWRYDRAK